TMFSVTNTGLNTLPLWTLNVRPTNSGVIIDRRDQVLIGTFEPLALALSILSIKCWSTNGPFLIERPITSKSLLLHGTAIAPHHNKTVGIFASVPRLVALGQQAPRRSQLLPA